MRTRAHPVGQGDASPAQLPSERACPAAGEVARGQRPGILAQQCGQGLVTAGGIAVATPQRFGQALEVVGSPREQQPDVLAALARRADVLDAEHRDLQPAARQAHQQGSQRRRASRVGPPVEQAASLLELGCRAARPRAVRLPAPPHEVVGESGEGLPLDGVTGRGPQHGTDQQLHGGAQQHLAARPDGAERGHGKAPEHDQSDDSLHAYDCPGRTRSREQARYRRPHGERDQLDRQVVRRKAADRGAQSRGRPRQRHPGERCSCALRQGHRAGGQRSDRSEHPCCGLAERDADAKCQRHREG